ncbi:unnamed protein product [Nesidiocoris tenuis]|uniref:FAT domain-containing protein n=1 Tax=Nesidiocoris tenuis TaxID=355587 RepID=A0A6H5FVG1_9HEMI|nr:unnamed protein product [Nesidiocoris tenuis]
MMLKAACSSNPSYVDRLITPFIRVIQRMAREHTLANQETPAATSDLLILSLDLVKNRVGVMQTDTKKAFIGSILVGLIEKTNDSKVMRSICKMVDEWMRNSKPPGPGGGVYMGPSLREKSILLGKLMQYVEKKFPELNTQFLELVNYIYRPLMSYLGKSHNLWHMVALSLEKMVADQATSNVQNKARREQLECYDFEPVETLPQQAAVEYLAEMYSYLKEEDMWCSLWQKTARYKETSIALAYEQQGYFEKAQGAYELALGKGRQDYATSPAPASLLAEEMLWEKQWIRPASVDRRAIRRNGEHRVHEGMAAASAHRLAHTFTVAASCSTEREQFEFDDGVLERVETVGGVAVFARDEEIVAVGARLLLLVGQHHVAGHVRRVAAHAPAVAGDAIVEIVIFAAPAEEGVREAVGFEEPAPPDGDGSADYRIVGHLVFENVYVGRHVADQFRTGVNVPPVLRYQVDVVENIAGRRLCELPAAFQFFDLLETDVEQFGPIEGPARHLFDYDDPVVEILRREERVHVGEEIVQVVGPVAVADDDGDPVERHAIFGPPSPARPHAVPLGQTVERLVGLRGHLGGGEDVANLGIPRRIEQPQALGVGH